jgi:hypothetical protein
VRGSKTAAELERERALRPRLTKAQRREMAAARKHARRERRRHEAREEERKAKETTMQQTTIPEAMKTTAKKRTRVCKKNPPMPAAAHATILARGEGFAIQVMRLVEPMLTENAHRTSWDTFVRDPEHQWSLGKTRMWEAVLEAIKSEKRAASEPGPAAWVSAGNHASMQPLGATAATASAPAPEDDKPLTLADLRALLPMLVGEAVKAALPAATQQPEPIIKIRQREQIRKIVEHGNGGNYRSRWRLLYSTAEVRWDVDWEALAKEHDISAEDTGYRLAVAAKAGRLDDLLMLAEELFLGAKSTAK